MIFLRRLLYYLAGTAFKLLLLLIPLVFAITVVFGTPANIEQALKDSHVYDQFVTIALDNSEKQAQDADAKKLLADPEVRAAIEKSFSPQLLEQSAGSVIHGVYDWLQGRTPEPQFTVDLTDAKAALTQNLSAYAEKRASGLPICTLAQLQTLDPETDLLSLPCRPPGTNPQQVGQQFSAQLLDDADFLDKPIITNQTVAENNGKSIADSAPQLPRLYQAVQALKWVLIGIAILLAALLIFARRNRKAGVRHVAWALISISFFWIVGLVIYWFMFDKANQGRATAEATQAMWLDGAKVLIADLNRVIGIFITCYLALGAGLLVFLKLRPVVQSVEESVPEAPLNDTVLAMQKPKDHIKSPPSNTQS